MENVLFLQSDVKDPFSFYARMRQKHPVYYDESNKIWAVYTYKYSKEILTTSYSQIPVLQSMAYQSDALSGIVKWLARLTNGVEHEGARSAAMHLMTRWKECDVPSLVHSLMGEPRLPATVEWVGSIAKRLPAFALIKGFGFSISDALQVLPEIENLVKLMIPVKSEEEIATIAGSVKRVKEKFDQYFSTDLPTNHEREVYFTNFIGLLIQSYDATSGLLSNALLQYVKRPDFRPTTLQGYINFVIESARLDPAVHNTRRTMVGNLHIGKHMIKSGDQVLIVLASANRDDDVLEQADEFVTDRKIANLSFGTGIHQCIAQHFSTQLAASLLHYLNMKYSRLEIQENEIQYEARINVRLPKKITLLVN